MSENTAKFRITATALESRPKEKSEAEIQLEKDKLLEADKQIQASMGEDAAMKVLKQALADLGIVVVANTYNSIDIQSVPSQYSTPEALAEALKGKMGDLFDQKGISIFKVDE